MAPDASGWDWIGINLDDGGALMAFRMRDHSGRHAWAGGTFRGPGRNVRDRFEPAEIRFSRAAALALAAHRRRVSGRDAGRRRATRSTRWSR